MIGCWSPRQLLLVATLACAPAFSIPLCAAQNQIQYQQATYPVGGIVENSLTHQPIARVLVGSIGNDVLTDSEGRFELQLPVGTAQIRLRRPGYAGQQPFGLPDAVQMVKIVPGMSPLTLYLTPAASIAARVELSTGDEPDGIHFTLYQKRVVDGHGQWVPSSTASTDSQGLVRFLSLNPSVPYAICSEASSDQPGPAAPGIIVYGYPATCFPGGADFATAIASPLALQPGQQAELDVDLTRQPFYPVSISVAGSAQGRAPFVQVHSQAGLPLGFIAAPRSSANGTTNLNLPNGSYYADVRTGNDPNAQRYGRVDFTVAGGPVAGLSLVPLPETPIPVQIERDFTADSNQHGASAIEWDGELNGAGSGVNLSLVPADGSTGGNFGGNLLPAPGSANGDLYQWHIAVQGHFWVHVDVMGPWYISSITSGGVDLASQPLVIGPGGTAEPIQITLRNDLGKLACTLALPPSSPTAANSSVSEINPVYVYAVPLFPTVMHMPQSTAQPPGQPSYPFSLPPGDYLVVASSSPQEFDLDDPQERSRLAAEGRRVTIQSGETTTVQLDTVITDAPQGNPAEASQ